MFETERGNRYFTRSYLTKFIGLSMINFNAEVSENDEIIYDRFNP